MASAPYNWINTYIFMVKRLVFEAEAMNSSILEVDQTEMPAQTVLCIHFL